MMAELVIGFLIGLVLLAFTAPWLFYWIERWMRWIDRHVDEISKRKGEHR